MDSTGFIRVSGALRESEIDHNIFPPWEYKVPLYSEQRYIEVKFLGSDYRHQEIVNALGNAGLMHREGEPTGPNDENNPRLKVLGIVPGCILFEDMAFQTK